MRASSLKFKNPTSVPTVHAVRSRSGIDLDGLVLVQAQTQTQAGLGWSEVALLCSASTRAGERR